MMFVLSNGARYDLDPVHHTVAYTGGGKGNRRDQKVAAIAASMLECGVRMGTEDCYVCGIGDCPRAPLAAMFHAARSRGLAVVYAG